MLITSSLLMTMMRQLWTNKKNRANRPYFFYDLTTQRISIYDVPTIGTTSIFRLEDGIITIAEK